MTTAHITWTEKRAWLRDYGKRKRALWALDCSADDLVRAHEYARKSGADYAVEIEAREALRVEGVRLPE